MEYVERFERMRLHFVGFDLCRPVVTGRRAAFRHVGDIELTACRSVRRRLFCKEFFVAFDPVHIEVRGVFVSPEIFEFGFGFMGDVARWEGAKENVPLLVARQGGLREVRASNDDGGNAPLVEEIPFCVKVSLVNACFNVGIFEQLSERVGIVEAEIRRCENAPLDSPSVAVERVFRRAPEFRWP